jgi:phosphoribosyl-ATP pyrophosphohydrolase/phosphoribosyl-AMP cyclohydrolase
MADQPEYEPQESGAGILDELFAVIQDRKRDMPEGSYTTKLFEAGVGRVAQKVIEEAGESAIAAVQGEEQQVAGEVADLLYHALVLLAASGSSPESVWQVLRERRRG